MLHKFRIFRNRSEHLGFAPQAGFSNTQITLRVGLGDIVHFVLNPIAKAIDKIVGTDLANCDSCKHRRELLNRYLRKNSRPYRGSNF